MKARKAPQPESPVAKSTLAQIWSLMLRAARFNGETFLELKNDEALTGQAFGVLTLVSLFYGIGFTTMNLLGPGSLTLTGFLLGVLTYMIWFLVTMLIWSITAFVVGTKLFRGVTTFKGLLRPLFFSTVPGLLFILMVIPITLASQIIFAVAWGWTIVAGVFAVKNAMGFSIQLSMLTFVIYVIVFSVMASEIFLSLLPR